MCLCTHVCVYMCVCVCVRACVRACMHAFLHACVYVCSRMGMELDISYGCIAGWLLYTLATLYTGLKKCHVRICNHCLILPDIHNVLFSLVFITFWQLEKKIV